MKFFTALTLLLSMGVAPAMGMETELRGDGGSRRISRTPRPPTFLETPEDHAEQDARDHEGKFTVSKFLGDVSRQIALKPIEKPQQTQAPNYIDGAISRSTSRRGAGPKPIDEPKGEGDIRASTMAKRGQKLVGKTRGAKDFLNRQATHFKTRKGKTVSNREVAETYNRHKDTISPILDSDPLKEGLSSAQVTDLRNFRSQMRDLKYGKGFSLSRMGSSIKDRVLGDKRLVNKAAGQAGQAKKVLDDFDVLNELRPLSVGTVHPSESLPVGTEQNPRKQIPEAYSAPPKKAPSSPPALERSVSVGAKPSSSRPLSVPPQPETDLPYVPKTDKSYDALHKLDIESDAERKHRAANKMDVPQPSSKPPSLQSATADDWYDRILWG